MRSAAIDVEHQPLIGAERRGLSGWGRLFSELAGGADTLDDGSASPAHARSCAERPGERRAGDRVGGIERGGFRSSDGSARGRRARASVHRARRRSAGRIPAPGVGDLGAVVLDVDVAARCAPRSRRGRRSRRAAVRRGGRLASIRTARSGSPRPSGIGRERAAVDGRRAPAGPRPRRARGSSAPGRRWRPDRRPCSRAGSPGPRITSGTLIASS